MADPLDKQLVEAVLTRPRRGKADLEEARLASLRPSRTPVAVEEDEDDDEDEDLDDADLTLAPTRWPKPLSLGSKSSARDLTPPRWR